MPRKNNEVVATLECMNKGCNALASVHQYQGGQKKGNFYLRCPECGANQSTGPVLHKYVKEHAHWRDGFEHLAGSDYKAAKFVQVPVAELEPEPEKPEPDSEPDSEPDEPSTAEGTEPDKKGARLLVGGLALLSVLGIAAIKG